MIIISVATVKPADKAKLRQLFRPPPFFSASVPFVGSQVVLRSNEPFIAAYDVSAEIVQPEIIRHLENATVTTTTNNSTNG
jgi:hypothetical protein